MSAFNSGSAQAPPQHPASGPGLGHTNAAGTHTNNPGYTGTTTGATPNTVNDGSAGAAAANTLGDKLKGTVNVVHGAGEGIRGNINSFLDNAGEQIAGRGQGDVKPVNRTDGGERPAHVAARGANEFEAGVAQLKH